MIFPDFARKVIFLFIIKFNERAIIRERTFDVENPKKIKKRLNETSSTKAPEAPAKQNEKNFLFKPITNQLKSNYLKVFNFFNK